MCVQTATQHVFCGIIIKGMLCGSTKRNFFIDNILCYSRLCVTDEFTMRENISSHNAAELCPAEDDVMCAA